MAPFVALAERLQGTAGPWAASQKCIPILMRKRTLPLAFLWNGSWRREEFNPRLWNLKLFGWWRQWVVTILATDLPSAAKGSVYLDEPIHDFALRQSQRVLLQNLNLFDLRDCREIGRPSFVLQ